MNWLPAALVCLLALPFHPFWPDFEAARRGVLLVCIGALALGARRWIGGRQDACSLLLLGLAAWHGLRSIGVHNPGLAMQATLGWVAVWVVFTWARRHRPEDWLRAGLVAGLAVSGYGLLQAFGVTGALHAALWQRDPDPAGWSTAWLWLQSFCQHGDVDPVSTLGNRNVASEFVAVSSAGAAVLLRRAGRWRLPWVTLAVGACYLVVNQSRSGMVALPLAVAFVLAQRSGARGRLLVMTALLAGAGVGLLGHLSAGSAAAAATPSTAVSTTSNPRPSTIEVRLLIWRGCAELTAERYALCFPKDHESLARDLNRALGELRAEGALDALDQRFGLASGAR